ncbi:pyocin knob domain-containing protein [Sinorhizobium meliloti]|uniref:pyocin knob domain-containing protein n=1 Tax=Rhizobium meliloti TaxID=382 RepID=UPI001F3D83EE|nr:pyocin knob domain-containing protein [Sinorhizobium meliloti]
MTAPYVTGTVSVTAGSAVVTGTGTAWATALIAGGLFGLDSSNGNPVPILSVDSNTQLTLAKPWRGTTAAGQGYWIIRDTAYLQQQTVNAQALSTYIQRLDNAALTALAGLNPSAEKFAYFTGPNSGALADIKAKGRDIMSAADMLGLLGKLGPVNGGFPSPVPSAAGVGLSDGDFNTVTVPGTYAITDSWVNGPSGAGSSIYAGIMEVTARFSHRWQVYVLSTSTESASWGRFYNGTTWSVWRRLAGELVGTVAQAGGIPAGAIIERGVNANGSYTKFADGTMICGGGIDLTSAVVGGAGYYNIVVTFPAAFALTEGNPRFMATLGFQSEASASFSNLTKYGAARYPTTTGGSIMIQTSGAFTTTVQAMWAAYGKWF